MLPLLLIHGTGADASVWDAVTPLLSAHHRVVAYDRRGCYRDGGANGARNGFDALPAARRETIVGHAADVAAELRSGTGESLTPARLAAITCPVTLVLGSRSAPMFARIGGKIAAAMPQLRTVTVDGAGHLMMLEAPRAFADAIISADTAMRSSPAA